MIYVGVWVSSLSPCVTFDFSFVQLLLCAFCVLFVARCSSVANVGDGYENVAVCSSWPVSYHEGTFSALFL